MSADAIVKTLISEVPKAVAAGVVDMNSGMLLAMKTVDSHPQAVLDILAPATRELFEGELISTIEDLFKRARGVQTTERYFQEVIVTSTNLLHFFGRVKSNPATVAVVVTRADANLGMVVMKARQVTASATV
jgi:predicted regulator of Ras-like GTPase activity (Roadblock/LC7/MglB family)